VALARQLACADVVLLNKADLLSEERCVFVCVWSFDDDVHMIPLILFHQNRLAAVEQRIRALNPLAQLHRTRYCNVPLQFVLDVDLPTDGGVGAAAAAMTHEVRIVSVGWRFGLISWLITTPQRQ
jgi:G3E family GTPase